MTSVAKEGKVAQANVEDVRLVRSREEVATLRTSFDRTIEKALETTSTPPVDLCGKAAAELARDRSNPVLTLGRAAKHWRNPADKPSTWVAPLIAQLETAPSRAGEHRTVELADGKLGYVEPIYMKRTCGTCHGEQISSAIRRALGRHHLKKPARNYKPGQLMGVYWVAVGRVDQ